MNIINLEFYSKESINMEKNIELQRIENFLETNEKIDVNGKMFKKIMFIYSVAQKEIENKLETLKNEFELFYDYELIDHINYRIKKPESIMSKMKNKELKYTYKEMIRNINDIAGIRVICPLKEDIYTIRNLISNLPGIKILKEKDYVSKPKKVDIQVII